jgi:hypothetical protein
MPFKLMSIVNTVASSLFLFFLSSLAKCHTQIHSYLRPGFGEVEAGDGKFS